MFEPLVYVGIIVVAVAGVLLCPVADQHHAFYLSVILGSSVMLVVSILKTGSCCDGRCDEDDKPQ